MRNRVEASRTVAFGGVKVGKLLSYRVGILNTSYKPPSIIPKFSFIQPIGLSLNLRALAKREQIIATGVANAGNGEGRLRSRLWLRHGIITHTDLGQGGPEFLARATAERYTPQGIAKVQYGENREVIPQELVSLKYYERADPEAVAQAKFFAKKLKELDPNGNDSIVHISSTPQGGGVAIMRHAEMRLAREMGLNMHWHVMKPDGEAFEVTKRKMHNIFQGVAPEGTELTDNDKRIYQKWIADNAVLFNDVFKSAKVLIIDDPQPSGLIPYAIKAAREAGHELTILYRSHIEIINRLTDTNGTPQNKLWDYLWNGDQSLGFDSSINGIRAAKAFITHPIKSFVPTNVPKERVFGMAPTTDRFDGLNKPLSKREMRIYLGAIDRILEESGQSAIDHSRPFVSQRARLDPSKGHDDLLKAFRITWNQINEQIKSGKKGLKLPQLVIIANAAADDPDADAVYSRLQDVLASEEFQNTRDYSDLLRDIKIIRVPHNDLLLNAVTRASRFVTQLSLREGFEFNVEEAIMKGKPVIGAKRGGIPLQIKDGVSGYLVNPIDPDKTEEEREEYYKEVAQHMYDLFTDNRLYRRMSRKARLSAHNDFKTERNVANWMWLAYNAVKETQDHEHLGEVTNGNFGQDDDANQGYVPRMVEADYARENGKLITRRRERRLRFLTL